MGTLTRSSWLQTATVFAAPPGLDGSLAHVLEVVLGVVFALHDRHLDDVHALNVRGADGRGLGGQRGDARVCVCALCPRRLNAAGGTARAGRHWHAGTCDRLNAVIAALRRHTAHLPPHPLPHTDRPRPAFHMACK